MKKIILLIAPLFLYATSNFITPIEYATQLYKNPRGIGCQNCHGDHGEGKLIANYMHKGKKKSFRGPAINKMDFSDFYKAVQERKRGMPRYFLTKKEVQALYLHLHQKRRREKKDDK